jgi:signal transduction histidine kinase
LEIRDEGEGIDAADLPHVFQPFFRSANSRLHGTTGVGLGLSIAARIVASLGGSITATSERGSGCSMVVRLATLHLPHASSSESAAISP